VDVLETSDNGVDGGLNIFGAGRQPRCDLGRSNGGDDAAFVVGLGCEAKGSDGGPWQGGGDKGLKCVKVGFIVE
jgi:hypothetical protein